MKPTIRPTTMIPMPAQNSRVPKSWLPSVLARMKAKLATAPPASMMSTQVHAAGLLP
jgi:hypothetical protein